MRPPHTIDTRSTPRGSLRCVGEEIGLRNDPPLQAFFHPVLTWRTPVN